MPTFLHGGHGFRPEKRRMSAGGNDIKPVTTMVSQEAFRDLAAGGIAGAQNEDALFSHGSGRPKLRMLGPAATAMNCLPLTR